MSSSATRPHFWAALPPNSHQGRCTNFNDRIIFAGSTTPSALAKRMLTRDLLVVANFLIAVVTRSSSKSSGSRTRHSSRLSVSTTPHTSPASSTRKRRHASLKSERSSSRGRPAEQPRRCSARKKLRLCVGDFLYSQGKF